MRQPQLIATVLGISKKPNTTTISICFQSARRQHKYVIVHVDQSAAPQDRSLRSRIVVIRAKRNITPFSGRMSHIHSPSSRSSTWSVLRVCSQGSATRTNPSSSLLASMRALALAAISRRRLAHFFHQEKCHLLARINYR